MAARIGINPLTWTNDDLPELGGDTPLETCLREAAAAGFQGMELGHKFPRRAPELRAALAPHGLALVSGWSSGNLLTRSVAAELADLTPHLDLLQALGANVVVFAETTGAVHGDRKAALSQRPHLDAAGWKRFCAASSELAERVAARGQRLAYHHHMGTVIESRDDIDRLMHGTKDSLGLLLDTGHLTYAGADPLAVARAYGSRIAHVHLKDVRPSVLAEAQSRDWPFLEAVLAGVFTVPGDGCVDYPAILKVLATAGYAGWLVVEAEQDPKKAHPLTYAKMGFSYVDAQARAAGLVVDPRGSRVING